MIFVFLFHRFSYISCINFRCLRLKAQLDLIRLFYCTTGCSVGYFAYAQYDVLFIPYRHFVPLPPKEEANYRLCERSEANSREGGGLRSIFSVLFQGDCRGTSCLAMTTSRAMVRWDISLTLNMTYFLHVILNDSEESHRGTDGAYTFHFGRKIFRLRLVQHA